MKKKILATLTAIGMVATMLIGCGSAAAEAPAPAAEAGFFLQK